MRALLVEDSSVMRKVLERALNQSSMEFSLVAIAANGIEALDILRRDELAGGVFDLVLCDINMPLMDGLQFLEACQAEGLGSKSKIVMITSEGSEALVLRAIAAGAKGYLCKPFTADQLRLRVLPLFETAKETLLTR
jgi:two-component system chemotaxis response regulator CheY